jgi:ligand-binding sensor domain-containing protein
MSKTRLLWALGAALALIAAGASVVLFRAGRALRTSAVETEREGVVPFSANVVDTQVPAGFESLAAPAGFRDAAPFAGRLYVAGDGGLFGYNPDGVLAESFRAGLELPAAPIAAIAVGTGGGSATPELWMATTGEGALAYDGSHFRHIRPSTPEARKLTAILPLTTGRVLFGTAATGVLAFDGKRLESFHPSLAGLQVTSLAGEESSLWIGTGNAGVYHWHAGQLDHLTEAEGMPDARVFSIAVDGPTAYAATALGVGELRQERVQRVLARGFTVQAVAKQGNRLVAGTLEEGLLHVPLEARSKPSSVGETANIRRLITVDGTLLALTPDGLYRTGARRGEFKPLLTAAAARLADRNISALAPASTGALWIGYFDRGLDIVDVAAGRARHLEDDVVFCVNRIVHDARGNRVAVATSNGLAMFSPSGERRQVLTRAEGLIATQVTDILFRPDGSVVVATPAGVSFIEASKISSIYAFHGVVNNHVYALGQNGPRTFVGTLGGLSILEGGRVTASYTTANSGFRHNWVTGVLPVGADTLIGTYGGGILHQGAGGAWVPFDDLPGAFEVNPNAMAASARAVYAGTLARGLALFDRSAGRWRWVIRGLPSLNVTAVAVEAGVVYIGTENGLVRVPEDTLLK